MDPTHAYRSDLLHDVDGIGHVLIPKKTGVLFRVGRMVLMNRVPERDAV